MAGRLATAVLAMALMLADGAGPVRAQSLEYQIKANYLVRFAVFVDWPAGAFPTAAAPLTLCIAGHDPFGQALDQAAAAQTAHGRRIAVQRLGAADGYQTCHIVYLGRGSGAPPPPAAAVLVVSDSAVGPERAMIHFVIVGNRVRFRIDEAAAARARLQMSSRLLNLAVDVREAPE